MSKYITPLFISFLLSVNISGQINNAASINLIEKVRAAKYLDTLNTRSYEGNPYLDENYCSASIKMSDNVVYEGILLRYNVFNDQFEFISDGQIYSVPKEKNLAEIILGDRVFELVPYNARISSGTSFMERLVTGYCSLYIQYQVKLLKGEASTGYSPATPDHFEKTSPLYFIRIGEGSARYVNNVDDLTSYISDGQDIIKSYIKAEKLNVKKVRDLEKVVRYINTCFK